MLQEPYIIIKLKHQVEKQGEVVRNQLPKYIFGISKELFSTAHEDPDIGTVYSVDFSVLPLRQQNIDQHKREELLYFKPRNHGIIMP